jgi:hypothetical protein
MPMSMLPMERRYVSLMLLVNLTWFGGESVCVQ